MTLPVFWSPGLDPDGRTGTDLVLDGDEGRHAVVVRRIRAGERIVLTDGAGHAATCEVTATDRASLTARVLRIDTEPAPRPHLTVVQAIPKGDRADLAVELLTEIGADRIVPWAAARCVAVWRGERAGKALAKWRAGAREAAKQSRRAWFPEVTAQATTDEVAALLGAVDLAVVLHEEAEAPLAGLDPGATGSVALVVGPEGGVTGPELESFAAIGATARRLGPTVLRTSTAGVAAASALLARTDRWA